MSEQVGKYKRLYGQTSVAETTESSGTSQQIQVLETMATSSHGINQPQKMALMANPVEY